MNIPTAASPIANVIKQYRDSGFTVIPLLPKAKTPAIPTWVEFQTHAPDDALIAEWLERYWNNGYNIGILCGKVSGNLVVVDIDTNDAWDDCQVKWQQKRNEILTESTLVASTGKGHHVYLRIRNLPESLRLDGIHIQAEGHYVVAPPSIHANGNTYKFINPEVDTILAMESLTDIGLSTISPQHTPIGLQVGLPPNWVVEALRGVPEGERNTNATRLAGYFRNSLPEDVVFEILASGFAPHCIPSFPLDELQRCVKSVYRYPIAVIPSEEFVVKSAAEIMAEPEVVVQSLWADILYPQTMHIIVGDSHVGKTTFIYGLATAAAKGEPFLSRPVKPMRVLYLDYETPQLLRPKKLRQINADAQNLFFATGINVQEHTQVLEDKIRELGVELLVVDTIHRGFNTQKEDDNAEATQRVRLLSGIIQRTGCAILLTSHVGKSKGNQGLHMMRGASEVVGGVDVVMNLVKRSTDVIVLKVAKNRWHDGNTDLTIKRAGEGKFELVGGIQHGFPDESKLLKVKARGIINNMLAGNGNIPTRRKDFIDKAKEGGIDYQNIDRVLKEQRYEHTNKGYYRLKPGEDTGKEK